MPTTTKTKKVTPKLTLDEIKAALAELGGYKREVYVELPDKLFMGTLDAILASIKEIATANDIPKPFEITKRGVKKFGYNTYDPRTQRYDKKVYYTFQTTVILGRREFTDAELEAEGPALIKRATAKKIKDDKQRAKDEAQFAILSAKLGK